MRKMLPNLLSLLVLGTLLTAPSNVHADTTDTTLETLMDAQMSDMLMIEAYAGSDSSTALQFSFAFDPNTGGFSYSLLPGQQWLGQSFSLSGTDAYDPSTTTFSWTTTGQLGEEAWTGQGTEQWSGDAPIGGSTDITTIGETKYLLDDSLSVTTNGNAIKSSGTMTLWELTATLPNKQYGPFSVSDTQTNNTATISTPESGYPISGGTMTYTFTPIPGGGSGGGKAVFTAPESGPGIFGIAAVSLLLACAGRRRMAKA